MGRRTRRLRLVWRGISAALAFSRFLAFAKAIFPFETVLLCLLHTQNSHQKEEKKGFRTPKQRHVYSSSSSFWPPPQSSHARSSCSGHGEVSYSVSFAVSAARAWSFSVGGTDFVVLLSVAKVAGDESVRVTRSWAGMKDLGCWRWLDRGAGWRLMYALDQCRIQGRKTRQLWRYIG